MSDEMVPIEFLLNATHLDELGWPAAAVGAAAWFLGPSIKNVRSNLAQWTDYQSANILGLFRKIKARQDELVPLEVIHPRVAAQILETASWADDELAQEYLAGLALDVSGKAADEGLFYARMIDAMTSAQIRLHYAFYRALVDSGAQFRVGFAAEAQANAIWAPTEQVSQLVGASPDGFAANEALIALEQAGLLTCHVDADPAEILSTYGSTVPEVSTAVTVTPLGASLYCRAHGVTYEDSADLFGVSDAYELGPTLSRSHVAPLWRGTIAYG